MGFLKKLGGAILGSAGGPIGSLLGASSLGKSDDDPPQALTRAPDFGRVSSGLGAGQDPSQLLQDYLAQTTTKGRSTLGQLGRLAPFITTGLTNVPAFGALQDFENLENPMQAFGAGAGMIGQGGAQALQRGQNQLARAGLGRSSAMAGLANRTASGVANQQAGLFTNLYQASQARRAANAQRAFDLHRQIAQMALGQTLTPRDAQFGNPNPGVSSGSAILSGGLAGLGAGAPLGPIGAGVGGLLGALGGALS